MRRNTTNDGRPSNKIAGKSAVEFNMTQSQMISIYRGRKRNKSKS